MANQHRPYVFIGSSSDGEKIARAIQTNLAKSCECQIWSQGLFGLMKGTLEELVNVTDKFDFAILVLTPDDVTVSRNRKYDVPRDNVLFELGLFIGSLGRERTFVVADHSAKLPSDFAGVTIRLFDPPNSGSKEAAVGSACDKIEEAIQRASRGRPCNKYSYESFIRLEEEVCDEVWIISPYFYIEPDPFYDVLVSNLSREKKYRYFVQSKYDYSHDLNLLLDRLSKDKRVKVNPKEFISVQALSLAEVPCCFVLLDPTSTAARGFALIEDDLQSLKCWIEISRSQVGRYVSIIRAASG